MSLKSFLSSLVPHFERNRIIEDIDSLSTDLTKHQIPNYKSALQHFKGHKWTSPKGKAMESIFHLRNPRLRSISHVQYTANVLENTSAILAGVEQLVPDLFARDVTKDGLTYKKAAVLQLLSIVRFFNNYSALHLTRLLSAETAASLNKEENPDAGMTPVDIRYLDENMETFYQVGQILLQPAQEIIDALGKMEDIQIAVDKINFVAQTMGTEAVDPLKLGFMGKTATSSPIYMVRARIASYQDATYKRNVELSKSIQLQLYQFKDAKQGKSDPALEQKIEYLQARLARLNQDVADYEARVAA